MGVEGAKRKTDSKTLNQSKSRKLFLRNSLTHQQQQNKARDQADFSRRCQQSAVKKSRNRERALTGEIASSHAGQGRWMSLWGPEADEKKEESVQAKMRSRKRCARGAAAAAREAIPLCSPILFAPVIDQ